ncbi:hypothetical protein [Lacticaseibacillus paracasei]|uniref:hypothetical protein n=1 Tax=Lacticaseibacillus paracasei TaxID=1597 RepID=UPI0005B4EA5B
MSRVSKSLSILASLIIALSPIVLSGYAVSASENDNSVKTNILLAGLPNNVVDPQNNLVSQTIDGNTVTFIYKVNPEQLAAIKRAYANSAKIMVPNSRFQTNGIQSVNGQNYTSTTNGSFKKSNVVTVAGYLAGLVSAGAGNVIGIAASVMSLSKGDIVYYHYTQTSWSASDGFHVSVNIKFYNNSSHTSYITQTTFNRVYQND